MEHQIYIQNAVDDCISYAAAHKAYEKTYFEQMKVFFAYLAEETKGYNLAYKRDCAGMQLAAIALVKGTKKEYPK